MKTNVKILLIIMMLTFYLVSMINITSALIIDSVSMTPDEIKPGETSTIRIDIENNGKEDIKDVSVSLNLIEVPFAPFDSASEYNIEEIESDDEETAKFKIIALNDAKSGIYKIPLGINYLEDGEIKSRESLISITVNSKPVIGVGVEDGLLLKNQENEILVEITNKGLSDVKFVEVEAGTSFYFNVLNAKNHYIGDIDSDDFDSVKFKIYFKKDVPDKIYLPVKVMYKDGVNNEYTENFNVLLNVYDTKKAVELGLIKKNNTYLYVGIVAGLIVVYFIYKRFRRWRKVKKIEEKD